MKHIDEWFREELGDGRETPPPQVWTELERRLDERRPRRRLWLWWITPVLLLGLLAGAYRAVQLLPHNRTAEAVVPEPGTDASAPAYPTSSAGENTGSVSPLTGPVAGAQNVVPAIAPVAVPAQDQSAAPLVSSGAPSSSAQGSTARPGTNSKPVRSATPGGAGSAHNHSAVSGVSSAAPASASGSTAVPAPDSGSAAASSTAVADEGQARRTSSVPVVSTNITPSGRPLAKNRTRRHRAPAVLPAASAAVQRHRHRQPFEPTAAPDRASGRRSSGDNIPSAAGSSSPSAGGIQAPVPAPRNNLPRNSPAMDSAIIAFNASGARLKIREGIFIVSIDTLIPASSGTAAASLIGVSGAEQGPDDAPDKPRRRISLEYGVRAGAERGTASATALKFIAGPYIKLPLSNRIAFSAQPAIRFGMVSGRNLGTRSYYSNTATSVDSFLVFDTSGTVVVQRKYVVSQEYDSSTISHTMARRLLEFELPVLMHYNFTNSFSMFGGFMLSFGKVIDLETKQTGLGRRKIINDTLYSVAPIPQSELENVEFKHTTEPLSNYKPDDYANPGSNPIRLGYMLGLSYKVQERIHIDLAMQQMLGGNFIPNTDVRKVYTQPYFRLMINYRLGKGKK